MVLGLKATGKMNPILRSFLDPTLGESWQGEGPAKSAGPLPSAQPLKIETWPEDHGPGFDPTGEGSAYQGEPAPKLTPRPLPGSGPQLDTMVQAIVRGTIGIEARSREAHVRDELIRLGWAPPGSVLAEACRVRDELSAECDKLHAALHKANMERDAAIARANDAEDRRLQLVTDLNRMIEGGD